MLVYVGFFILTFVGGVFGGYKPPPCDSDPSCPKNEHYTRNNPRCIRTCANKWVPISDDCKPFTGCVCDGDLVRLNDDGSGPCVPEQKCPCKDDPKKPNNPKRQVYTAHAEAEAFAAVTQEKTTSDGKSLSHFGSKASSLAKSSSSSYASVKSSDRRDPSCPKNEHYTRNNLRCIRTCANKWEPICDNCKPFTGCVCDGDLVRLNDDGSGPCVPEQKCPCRDDPKKPNNPKHQVYTAHAEAEAFAAVTQEKTISDVKSLSHSSSKASSFSKSSSSSYTSVISSDCRDKKCSDPNAVYKDCPNPCPLTCAKPYPRPCPYKCINKGGCECASGYVLNEATGRCVRPKDCPRRKCKDPNAVYKSCPNPCPISCDHPFPKQICNRACLEFGCECAPGFLLDVNDMHGKCIRPEDCPVPICCPKYSHYVINDSQCPQTCGNRLLPNSDVAGACVPFTGCTCNPGFVRKYDNATGPCIPERECPPIPKHCGINETPTSCRIVCPPQTCESIFSKYYCLPTDCEPGCDCLNDYLRKDGVCIPSEDCFKPEPIECGPNEVPSDCAIVCPPQSCESLFRTYKCAETNCTAGCNCIDGYLRNSRGVCVPTEECYNDPAECNGDLNATRVRGCSDACPPTCEKPNPEICPTICILNGCDCKPGYIRSCDDGYCIEPKDCPGGSPKCGANQTYVGCKIGCPTNYCPVDDSRAQVACSMPYPCRGGCACKTGHLIVSREDPRCVLASDCPKVKCTRPNEVWDRNPSSCFLERCEDRGSVCDHPYPSLAPRCVCKKGYYRNENDICIPASECPPLGCKGDLNATLKQCPSPCPKTCDDPNAGSEGCIEICLPDDCECNPGFVLTEEKGGVCIKLEDCPGCGGDPNAVYSTCPSACEPTCTNPGPRACTRQCMPSGCVCKPGFVINEKNGKCIKPEKCPVGCKGDCNATYKECTSMCPLTCAEPDPRPCIDMCGPSGCECNPGYVLNEDGKCIKPEDCPVVGCKGDCNATYTDCTSMCPLTCAEPDPRPCIAMCGPSGCECKPGYVLNEDGKCIKPEDCPVVDKGCNGDLNATHSDCPSACPVTCANRYSKEKILCPAVCDPSGCVCKKGYILTEKGGICVKPEDCPEVGCKGDPNAEYSDCPSACQATCEKPDSNQPCTTQCLKRGCVCKPGFIRIEKGGKCIKPENCPVPGCGGDPNAVYSECPSACEPSCANPNPEICTMQCMPSGCVCKPGFVQSKKGGKCIKPEECPDLCKGDRNATFVECPKCCQATCKHPDTDGLCNDTCLPPGCVCKQGHLLNKKGGVCIKPEDCPGGWPTCRANETYVYCKVGCPTNYCPVDDSLAIIACDPMYPCPGGCACKGGYLMATEEDDRCILSSECPKVKCTRPNEVWDPYAPGCLHERCDDRDIPCDFQYPGPPRCRCIKGYYRNKDDICVPECQCPQKGCNGDMNATLSDCPSKCPATCCDPDPICTTEQSLVHIGLGLQPESAQVEPGCVCKDGFLQSEPGGPCIRPYDCEGGSPQCCDNMTYVNCKIDCPMKYCPEDENEIFRICDPIWPCPSGCACKPGYLMPSKANKICILAADCPSRECTRPNEVWDPSPSICNYERCDQMYYTCGDPNPGRPKCVCKEGYCKDKSGVCIPAEESPKPKCGYNEVAVPCRQKCPPQNCEIAYTDYACTEESKICEPGCDCLPDHLRNGSGICIPNEECPYPSTPVCGINEIARDCRQICPPQICLSKYALFRCIEDLPCEPGCDCVPNYLRDDRGICIPSEQCPPLEPICGFNEVAVPCRQICPPQNCEMAYTDYACTEESKICEPGCDCLPDHLRNGSGICIPNEQCPYPSTPVCGINEIARDCRRICPPQTCLSKYAFFYCIEDLPCEPGCDCVPNYLRDDRGICIPSEQCPPLEPICGYNEVAVPCRQICPPQNCEIAYTDYACTGESKICEPGCDCLPNHLRNGSGICIPSEQCPAPCQIPDECKRTCAEPNPPNCAYNPPNVNMNGCDCKDGYILSKLGGDCIPIDQCPPDTPCAGDPNARPKRCPKPCPSTCTSPNQLPCKRMCEPIGCQCKSGYILSNDTDTGRCILPDKCPGGNPCGKKAHFVDCKTDYPGDYCPVDDSRDLVLCEPPPVDDCLSGCICNLNHRRKSHKDPRCIVSSDCPPVNCTRPNEIWCSCPSACLAENCEDVNNQPTECKTVVLNCDPRCICTKDHFRNSSGICIPAEDCPQRGCKGDMNATFSDCPSKCPATCCDPNPICTKDCADPGCVCIEGFIQSEPGGPCIKPCDCPVQKGCNGDMNATFSDCPSKCPATCCDPNPICTKDCADPGCVCIEGFIQSEPGGPCIKPCDCPVKKGCKGDMNATFSYCPSKCPATCCDPDPVCTKDCADPGCVCNEEFIQSEPGGPCIKPCDCPGGSPLCSGNMTYVNCKIDCPMNYCPEDENEIFVICDPIWPCPSGCVCKPGYLMANTCILAADCPSRECTRPNEVWDSSPSICNYETCDQMYYTCDDPNPGRPKCVCKEGYCKDNSGVCIPAEECPKPICGYNEVAVPCRQICPPQNCEIAYTDYACTEESKICEPGCDCLPDHLRNGSGICIPNEQCPSCQIPDKCKRTCAEPNPPNCAYNPPKVNMDGCDCKDGYVLSELGGNCIPINKCPPDIACHGDPNARPKRCPKPCPSTCKSPNEVACLKMCEPIGCECKPGFILSNDTLGLCILPDNCPGGNPCGKKAHFVDCKTDYPGDYCPVDDSRDLVFFEPLPLDDCLSGCICNVNHRRKSRKDPRCIVSSDCPRINCTRPNEKWSSCPSACLAENCEDVGNQPNVCFPLILNCDPRCICKKNHFRNSSGICIPAKDCPIGCNGDPNAVFSKCPSYCEPTCTNPNPEIYSTDCKPEGCVCKPGFVLNEDDGLCIELEDCPGCGGDPNAVYKDCPSACEPTCANPNPQVCTDECKPSGCVCKPGFVLNEEDGKCIHPDSCPGC